MLPTTYFSSLLSSGNTARLILFTKPISKMASNQRRHPANSSAPTIIRSQVLSESQIDTLESYLFGTLFSAAAALLITSALGYLSFVQIMLGIVALGVTTVTYTHIFERDRNGYFIRGPFQTRPLDPRQEY
ncbi:hypothetical protein BDV96DRAFT_638716 [Lophiotrema nucula]|uniref:Transmembrane protein n=1 Tax=Lophiotrema nucula TaxID=690887 RepID=A0A6A5YEF3_9PLEO|nr:hypothetical protein BDV96DRAFT_638716 [Lophiotrema nucula]